MWVEEQSHIETTQEWVVDTPAYDETVYDTVETVVHHDAEGYTEVTPAWDEPVVNEDGTTTYIHHDAVSKWIETSPAWDETVTSQVPRTVHHDEVGHYEYVQTKVVDVEGHWETVTQ